MMDEPGIDIFVVENIIRTSAMRPPPGNWKMKHSRVSGSRRSHVRSTASKRDR